MKEQLISQIVPILIACIVGILAVIIKAIGNAIIAFIKVKQEEVIKRIGQAKYAEEIGIAHDIWLIVEEHFRINKTIENVTSEKIILFDKLLLEKIPYLTQKDIDFLRQTIAGEFNGWKVNYPTTEGTTTAESEPTADTIEATIPTEV